MSFNNKIKLKQKAMAGCKKSEYEYYKDIIKELNKNNSLKSNSY